MCLSLELRAGRMIRPVNQDVAVQTGARGQLCSRGGRSGLLGALDRRDGRAGQVRTAVDLGGVVATMAVLAQPGHSRLQKRRVAGAVRRVAIGAIVRNRSMLQRYGPRFSAWQVKQVSLTEFLTSNFGPVEPWGL